MLSDPAYVMKNYEAIVAHQKAKVEARALAGL